MPIEVHDEGHGNVVTVRASGKLDRADYAGFVPAFAKLAREHGKLRVLFDVTELQGWDLPAAWEDFKFGVEHSADFERLAMVGDKRWEEVMAMFWKPFTRAEVRYFDQAELAAAQAWVAAEGSGQAP
jgi:hypothetical protein